MKKEYKKLGEKKIHIQDNISGYDKNVIVKTFRLPNGIIENYFIDSNKDSVQILPITHDKKIILVKQFRPGFEREEIELPGGGIEHGEDIYECAKRELLEETGLRCETLIHLGTIPYTPYSTGVRHSFVAVDCYKIDEKDLDHNEFLSNVHYDLHDFISEIEKGSIRGTDCAFMGLYRLGLL